MAPKVDKLSYFGYNFQLKVIASLLSDRAFLQQISDILKPTYFESEGFQWVVDNIINYFNEYKTVPTLEVFKVKLSELLTDANNKSPEILVTSIKEVLKDSFKLFGSDDLPYIKERAIEFCCNQEMKIAILESVDLLRDGKFDKIKFKIDKALRAGSDNNIGHDYLTEVHNRLTQDVRNTKATPWDIINDITDGGFAPGELVVFAAPPGGGKSMSLVNIGAHAMKKGLNVIYYTLELNEGYVAKRFDSYFTGIPQQNLRFHEEELVDALKKVPGKLIVKYYPTKTASVSTIVAHLEKCILTGFAPDIVIVDYADLLKDVSMGKETKEHAVLGNIYSELRGVAGTYNIPVYTASQINRSGAESDIIQGTSIAASYEKLMIADFVISLSRKMTDKISGTGRWHVIKNRFGVDGVTFPSTMNMTTCQINIYEDKSVEGVKANKSMANSDDVLRQMAAKRYEEINSKKVSKSKLD